MVQRSQDMFRHISMREKFRQEIAQEMSTRRLFLDLKRQMKRLHVVQNFLIIPVKEKSALNESYLSDSV